MTPTTECKRFQRLVATIDKSLSESRKAFDTISAVKECYGDDASLFENAGTENMLGEVMDGMVEGVNERVKEEMMKVFATKNVEEKLRKVENIIIAFDNLEAQEKKQEANDRQSARNALHSTKLPDGVSPSDIVSYHAHTTMKEEQNKLLAEISEIEGEIQQMEEQLEKGNSAIEKQMKNINEVGTELERTADVCSMVA